jgi:hypothetical protein
MDDHVLRCPLDGSVDDVHRGVDAFQVGAGFGFLKHLGEELVVGTVGLGLVGGWSAVRGHEVPSVCGTYLARADQYRKESQQFWDL